MFVVCDRKTPTWYACCGSTKFPCTDTVDRQTSKITTAETRHSLVAADVIRLCLVPGSVMEISAFVVLMLMFVPASPRYKSQRQLKIQCGKDSRTEKVNVTYIGEARMMYSLKNGVKQEKCQAEHVGQVGLVLLDINHREECGFRHLHKTNTWTIQVRIQHVDKILTALDKEYYLTCVYDAYKNVSRYKGSGSN